MVMHYIGKGGSSPVITSVSIGFKKGGSSKTKKPKSKSGRRKKEKP